MKNLQATKTKLEQKKARLQMEEIKMKIKEQKIFTRLLIDLGKLVVKAELDSVPKNTLYGALLSIQKQIQENNPKTLETWTQLGASKLETEKKEAQTIILTIDNTEEQTKELTAKLKSLGLKWNFARKEYYGRVIDLKSLNEILKNYDHNIKKL